MKLNQKETHKTILQFIAIILISILFAYLNVKQYYYFILVMLVVTVFLCINWPFFAVWLISWFSIIQPGLFDETLNSFYPFLIFSAATLLSWFLGFTNRRFDECALNAQTLFIFILMIAETVGTFQLGWFQYSWEVFLLWLRLFFLYFLVASLVRTNKHVRLIMWVTAFSVLIIAFYALNTWFNYPEKLINGRLASYGMYDNPNDLALIMVVIWPILFKLFEIEKSTWVAVTLIIMLLIITGTIVLTVSRGGLLGLGTVGLFCLWSFTRISKRARNIIVSCSVALFLAATPVILSQRGTESGFDAEDESASARIDAWRAGGRILLTHPAGIGFNLFPDFVGDYGGPSNLMAHNTPVKVAAEAGYLGIFCYLGTIFFTLKQLIFLEHKETVKTQPATLALLQGLRIGLIGFLINTSFSVKEHEWLLYIVLGLSIALINREHGKELAAVSALRTIKIPTWGKFAGQN